MVDRMGPIQECDRSFAVAIVTYMAGFGGSVSMFSGDTSMRLVACNLAIAFFRLASFASSFISTLADA